MRRGNFYIKLTTAALFLAVVGYIGVYLYNSAQNTYVTAEAFAYSIEDTVPAQGYIIRSEVVITEAGETVMPIVNEGEKVASGQAVAVEYTSSTAIKTASEIRDLRLRIAQIEAVGNSSVVETAGFESIIELSKAVQNGNLGRLDEIALKIETLIFTEGASLSKQLPALKARLASLENQSVGVSTINAPVSGVFSHAVDGYEYIGPSLLPGIKPSGLALLFADQHRISSAAGKLVTDFKWYFAAVMDASDVSKLSIGQRKVLQFLGSYHAQAEMLIESIGRNEDEECVVLFSSNNGVHEITLLRQLTAEIVISEVSGIRVPKESIRLDDDGATFIYLQTGARAERVKADILHEFADGYLLRDGAETGTPLRAGATIIVKANNLYDGKVVAG